MAIIFDLDGYRVETHRQLPAGAQENSRAAILTVRVVRKRDERFVDFGRDIEVAFNLLWEVVNGTSEAELRADLEAWIDWMEVQAAREEALGGTWWEMPEAVGASSP